MVDVDAGADSTLADREHAEQISLTGDIVMGPSWDVNPAPRSRAVVPRSA